VTWNTETALDYLLLKYMQTGLGRKNWRGGLLNQHELLGADIVTCTII